MYSIYQSANSTAKGKFFTPFGKFKAFYMLFGCLMQQGCKSQVWFYSEK